MLSLIKKRRSIRVFQNRKVEREKIQQMMQAALLSPSSKNNNPWKFIIVEDEEMLLQLSNSKMHGSRFVANAPLSIIIIADPKKSDVWIEDASIATTFIMLTAQGLGLGSCWVQLRARNHSEKQSSEEFVKNLLHIPDHLRVLCMIAIGYPGEEKPDKQIEKEKLRDIYLNNYGNIENAL